MRKPTIEELNLIDMEPIKKLVHPEMHYVVGNPGKEHYRLLYWIGKNFSGTIYEIGTHLGASSTSLSNGGNRKIITYDVVSWPKYTIPANEYRVKNPIEDIKEIASADLIFYDTAHNGIVEREFSKKLDEENYKGIVVYDDIYLNAEMKSFWNDIPQRKEDWTDIGHWSGTGIVFYK